MPQTFKQLIQIESLSQVL